MTLAPDIERSISVRADRLQVWSVDLDDRGLLRADVLHADEIARAHRFRFDRDRDRFIAGRVALRDILARYVGVAAPVVRLSYGPNGKPALDRTHGRGVHFNVSNSDAIAVVAVAATRVGIDIEAPLTRVEDGLVDQYFSAGEAAQLRQVPESEFCEAFLRCWTRKEAFVKALGGGLQLSLDRFEVSLSRDRPCVLWSDYDESARWSVVDLGRELSPYVSALVVEGPRPDLQFITYRKDLT